MTLSAFSFAAFPKVTFLRSIGVVTVLTSRVVSVMLCAQTRV